MADNPAGWLPAAWVQHAIANQIVLVFMGTTAVATPTIELSKAGGAFAAPSDGTWAELSDGWYTVTLDATDVNTLGEMGLRVVKGTDHGFRLVHVALDHSEMRSDLRRNRTTFRENR